MVTGMETKRKNLKIMRKKLKNNEAKQVKKQRQLRC